MAAPRPAPGVLPCALIAICCLPGCTAPNPRAKAVHAVPPPPQAAPATRAAAGPRPTTAPMANPTLRAAVRKSLTVGMHVNQWREDCDLIGVVSCRDAPAPFDFEAYAVAGGREWGLGRLTAARGETAEHYFMIDAEKIPGFMEVVKDEPRVAVALRPVRGATGGDDAPWGEDVWFPKVIVPWTWY